MMKLIDTANTIEMISTENIISIEACQNYSKLHLQDQKIVLSRSALGSFADGLTEKFFRIHHSYIINLTMVKRYHRDGEVELINGMKLPVARRRRTIFIESLKAIHKKLLQKQAY